MLTLDHLAISAGVLDEGREAVEAALGVPMQAGGKHPYFGTQNMLLRLNDGLYLEVISIDPLAAPPQRPRWFDLDNFSGAPRLSNWICATNDIDAAVAASPAGVGQPVALTRGTLDWKMAVSEDGKLPFDGGYPALIEWGGDGRNPSRRLAPSKCELTRLVVVHPEADRLRAALAPMLQDIRVIIEHGDTPNLLAEISTPHGIRVLP